MPRWTIWWIPASHHCPTKPRFDHQTSLTSIAFGHLWSSICRYGCGAGALGWWGDPWLPPTAGGRSAELWGGSGCVYLFDLLPWLEQGMRVCWVQNGQCQEAAVRWISDLDSWLLTLSKKPRWSRLCGHESPGQIKGFSLYSNRTVGSKQAHLASTPAPPVPQAVSLQQQARWQTFASM